MRPKNIPYYGKPEDVFHWLEEIWSLDQMETISESKKPKPKKAIIEGKVPQKNKKKICKPHRASQSRSQTPYDAVEYNPMQFWWVM